MNLHEYQGKNILENFGVGIQRGFIASSPKEAMDSAKKLTELTNTKFYVIKAQIHAR